MTASPDAPPDALELARGPFGASVRGVLDLLPDASLAPARPAPTAPASAGGSAGASLGRVSRVVSVDEVAGWVLELSATVAVVIDGYTRLPDAVAAGSPPWILSDRDVFVLEARRLVHAGAASYLEAARSRGGAGPNTTTTGYAEVLWARFSDGLQRLGDALARRLAGPDPSTPDDAGDAGGATGLAVGHFPPPAFGRRTGF